MNQQIAVDEIEKRKRVSHEEDEKIWENGDPPPSYPSLFGQFKEVKEKSDGPFDFMKTATQLFAGTIGCTIATCFLLALPTAMIVIGVHFRHNCPVEPFIPIYLIIAGSCGLLKCLTLSFEKFKSCNTTQEQAFVENYSSNEDLSNTSKFMDGLLNIFMFTWFIAGNVWVYSHYKPNMKPSSKNLSNYCDPTVYWFAFWVVTVSYVIMGIIFFCICCLGACASCTAFFVTKS
ncbi:transmembrane protein 272-like isoform X2 [Xenia sp. Carnegie-2017]|uniref:transmembrane protein 272-like isoform X2 n=1 Tax=Xenia sp. Carnegie-2017 TaxID=2897299 RepID=UPI001F03E793|nr:transmembrane protein 272-like isoform X2 [Xenia sp. Carnegie-2017]